MNEQIEKEMKALLYNFWILKEIDIDMYYQIKRKENLIKDFVFKNLGSKLIVHDKFIKLEKIPTIIKDNFSFNLTTNMEYVILTIILLYLEDKTKGDYFILSNLIEYIKTTCITLKLNNIPDWNKTQDRRYLLNVLDLLTNLNVIKIKDASKQSFIETIEAEILYETTGLSNYVMRMFDGSIDEYTTIKDFTMNEYANQESEKGDVRRHKVFRNILYNPIVSSKDLIDSELDYIKKNRNYIKNEIDKNLNMYTEITNNLTILYDNESNEKDNFPNTKKLTDIVLMVNEKIYNEIKTGKLLLSENELCIVKESYFETLIKEVKMSKTIYIGKTLSKETDKRFYDMIKNYMISYGFIESIDGNIIIYPTISRLIGKTNNITINNNEQISLFEGSDEND